MDDFVAPFSLDNAPVRGRVTRLAVGALDPILRRHDYPRPIALLLGEALTLASLVGSLLKAKGKLVLQAEGDGPLSLLVAEYKDDGSLRGYARVRDGAADDLASAHRMSPKALIGEGRLALTLDQGDDTPAYQGVVAFEGDTLSAAVENYFRTSQQTETRMRLAVGEVFEGAGPAFWRAGGVLMQRIAPDHARGDVEEDWSRATILFDTVTDAELIDPALPADRLLYRLFHEEGVRMGETAGVVDRCSCDEKRLAAVLKRLPPEDVESLVEPDGLIHANCQFCSRKYLIEPAV